MTGPRRPGQPTPLEVTGPLPRMASSWELPALVMGLSLAAGVVIASAPLVAALAVAVLAVGATVWVHPPVAAYLVLGVTPLVVGIERGTLLPVLRPNEALVGLLTAVLVLRAGVRLARGNRPTLPRPHPVELALLSLAVASSVLPLAWMTIRGVAPTGDDFSYALVLWKYLVVYGVVRVTVCTDQQVGRCLHVIQASSLCVGTIAVLQALDLLGVRHLLARWYAPLGHEGALDLARAGSTLALPAATADLMIITTVLAIGMWLRERRHGAWHATVGTVCVLATFAAAEFSSVLGLVIATICVAVVLNRKDIILLAMGALAVGVILMWPIVDARLQGFQSAYGVPESWIGRWRNLQTYFWPDLTSGQGWNILFGVRPAARVPVSSQATGFVWIESGYTWILWGGGLPLLLAFAGFVTSAARLVLVPARALSSNVGAAALAAFASIVSLCVLMIFDPHLTYRGAADCLFSLLAMCVAASVTSNTAGPGTLGLGTAGTGTAERAQARSASGGALTAGIGRG